MADCLSRKGVWAVFSGNAPQVMRFQIPITASMAEVEDILRRIKAAVRVMRVYLIFLRPLAVIPFMRRILDNVHVQIIVFNLLRDIEEFVRRLFPKKQEVKI